MTAGEPRRASLLLRVVSKTIDVILIFAASEALPKVGWYAGVGYLLIGDGLFGGRSLGKRLTGLRVLTESGSPCTMRESILRNLIPCVGLLSWKVPLVGWVLSVVVAVFEFLLMLGSKEGKRLGDEIARTSVVEIEDKAKAEIKET